MAYLDTYTEVLDSAGAAHLLRRATFGPTQQEIKDFTGKTADEAVQILIANASRRRTPPPPVEMDETRPDAGKPFITKPFDLSRTYTYLNYVQYWWIGLMTEQTGYPSVLEKLTAFWQNHFVVNGSEVQDYRFTNQYLNLLRGHALGNFRDMVIGVTKDPAMLVFQNGDKNSKERPNENYARELQELFTVGQRDVEGNYNYTEEDVKEAARVLTGWQVFNRNKKDSTTFGVQYNADRHDTGAKNFSPKYNNTSIAGRSGPTSGDEELSDLVNMLLSHPQSPRFICRKLYRWYVNPNITQEIEDQVVIPLAAFFSSAANNFAIEPVIRKLLASNIFFDQRNIAAIVKSPAELMIGAMRFFEQPVPDMTSDYVAFRKMMNFINYSINLQQLDFLNQPTVFGSLPYYQTGYSRNWINETTLGLRGSRTDMLVYPSYTVKTGYKIGIEVLERLKSIQPNFSDVQGTPAITCEQVLAEYTRNLFPVELSQAQKDFLIDAIMMMKSSPRMTWTKEWNNYRSAPADVTRQNIVLWRVRALLKYLLRMAEYQIF
ncbi:DUF1800 family protein [Dyadobacter sp. Leaf189]|uniref:DUF1800 domain-containing protein n=1 Tax=Dyadobacter sp. Leaf189 TaxID=1736295 RepID=UPI0006F35BF4|nr:DUF1800 domain-containing protein [Dyadobacter sp. Leaf189]KQS30686.1 hypothetical protein ASG33_09855 [Dyadobacter sp. Leaf189]